MGPNVTIRLIGPGLLLLALLHPPLALAAASDIAYEGRMLTRTIHVDKLRNLFASVDGHAETRAEAVTRLPLDRERVRIVLEDLIPEKALQTTAFSTGGHDTTTIRIRAQVWLRTAAYDSVTAYRALTREYVRAILLQQLTPEDSAKLPEWFHEGVATHLAGETEKRLHIAIAKNPNNPWELCVGLKDGPAKNAHLSGAWWLEALEAQRGAEATRTLLKGLVEAGNLYEPLSAIECSMEDLWKLAEDCGMKAISSVINDDYLELMACVAKQADGPEQGLIEFRRFIKKYPNTYAGHLALFYASKPAMELQFIPEARDYLSRLDQSPYDFGMGDPIMFLRIMIEYECDETALTRRLCEDYFGLWPDGYFYETLQLIYSNL